MDTYIGLFQMKMPTDKEWYERKAKEEGDLEISAGRSKTMVGPNASDVASAALRKIVFEALPQWARDRINQLEANKIALLMDACRLLEGARQEIVNSFNVKGEFVEMDEFHTAAKEHLAEIDAFISRAKEHIKQSASTAADDQASTSEQIRTSVAVGMAADRCLKIWTKSNNVGE